MANEKTTLSEERLAELKAFIELVKRMIEEEWSVTGTFGDDGIGQAIRDTEDIAALLAADATEKPASAPAAEEPHAIAVRLAAAGHVTQLRYIVEALAQLTHAAPPGSSEKIIVSSLGVLATILLEVCQQLGER